MRGLLQARQKRRGSCRPVINTGIGSQSQVGGDVTVAHIRSVHQLRFKFQSTCSLMRLFIFYLFILGLIGLVSCLPLGDPDQHNHFLLTKRMTHEGGSSSHEVKVPPQVQNSNQARQLHHSKSAASSMRTVKRLGQFHAEQANVANALFLTSVHGVTQNAKRLREASKELVNKSHPPKIHPDGSVGQRGSEHSDSESEGELQEVDRRRPITKVAKYTANTLGWSLATPLLAAPTTLLGHGLNMLMLPINSAPFIAKGAYHKTMQGAYKVNQCIVDACKKVKTKKD
jgi:hypothetical protein